MRERTLLVWCFSVAASIASLSPSPAHGEAQQGTQAPASLDPARLVREVVYNEIHDHDSHGFWRYWVKRDAGNKTILQDQIETADGPVDWVKLSNGHPPDLSARDEEERRLQHLISSPSEQAEHRKAYAEDEHRIGRILALLPEAFLYEINPLQTLPQGLCYHLSFRPNPNYPAHSIEARIFHAMVGELWISVQNKHLVRLEGKMQDNVDFGYGILGRLYKGGWFRLDRTQITSLGGLTDWKTERLEVHMIGRAMLFKTIAHETSEVRGGFSQVPAGLTLRQAAAMLTVSSASNELASGVAALPVALVHQNQR